MRFSGFGEMDCHFDVSFSFVPCSPPTLLAM